MKAAPINGEYFHVSHNKSYNSFGPMALDSHFYVGDKKNPFTQVYEKAVDFKVTTPSGPERVPALQFLREVKSGNIKCPDLPIQAYKIANYYNTLARELILEEVRARIAPMAPSRKTCLWVSDNLEMALKWQRKLTQRSRIFRVALEGIFHAADARLMMNESEPLEHVFKKAEGYWNSELSHHPLPEILFAGNVTVLEEIQTT